METVATIEQNGVRASFDAERGSFDLELAPFSLKNLQAGFEGAHGVLAGADLVWQLGETTQDTIRIIGNGDGLTLEMSLVARQIETDEAPLPAITVSAEVYGEKSFTLERIILMQTKQLFGLDWIFGQEFGHVGNLPANRDQAFAGSFATGFTSSGQTLFLSFPVRQPLPCKVSCRTEGGLVKDFVVECAVALDDQTRVVATPLTLCATGKPHGFLESYGRAQRTKDMPPIGRRPVAWNSWDNVYNIVSEDYILKNLELIANDPVLSKAVETIVIDDGWQHLYGEWEPNHRFPHGMEWLAGQIVSRGFQAGLWIAPSVIDNFSVMAYWNSHLLAQGKSRRPCQAFECLLRHGFALDIMQDEARGWITDLMKRYRKMGYTYFKLDYMRHMCKAHYFGGRRVPKGNLIRELISLVRQAVGDDVHLLGCVRFWQCGGGVVDSARISGDIYPDFRTIRENVKSIACRYWSHNQLWCNDPDFAICRGSDTSDDPNLNRVRDDHIYILPDDENVPPPEPPLTLVEARTLQSLILLSGGSITLSDDLTALNETGLDLLRKTVTAEVGHAARPIDLFETEHPSLWVQWLESGKMRIGVINWTDEPVCRRIDVVALTGRDLSDAQDFWNDEPVPLAGGKMELEIQPHQTKLLVLS